ncbi:MAG: 2-dehydro-3-deoxy-6-phosphogalactonate aldolase [Rhodospirillaceae bacterium]|nr:2-dehydro-3-deoxy-6-phosphogalactonate aldolase [Rhodospirillaceae bacterium]
MSAIKPWLDICPLVAILRGIRPDEVVAVGEAVFQAGFRIIEVPLNSPDPLQSIRGLSDRFGSEALVGAGTVLEPSTITSIATAGARVVVMPHAGRAVVEVAKAAGLLVIPGFATPTEAFAMIEAGADAIKLFPADANPPAVLKAMRAVLPIEIPILPVGGITTDKMAEYSAAGAEGFGLGSALYKPGMSADEVGVRARSFVEAL